MRLDLSLLKFNKRFKKGLATKRNMFRYQYVFGQSKEVCGIVKNENEEKSVERNNVETPRCPKPVPSFPGWIIQCQAFVPANLDGSRLHYQFLR
jgi:hypothetical protein